MKRIDILTENLLFISDLVLPCALVCLEAILVGTFTSLLLELYIWHPSSYFILNWQWILISTLSKPLYDSNSFEHIPLEVWDWAMNKNHNKLLSNDFFILWTEKSTKCVQFKSGYFLWFFFLLRCHLAVADVKRKFPHFPNLQYFLYNPIPKALPLSQAYRLGSKPWSACTSLP